MANFESGVSRYIHAYATVHVGFPVDLKGNPDVSCSQCYYFRKNYKTCGLNGEICEYPQNYIGSHCPLKILEEEQKK